MGKENGPRAPANSSFGSCDGEAAAGLVRWLDRVAREGKSESVFELETWLKGLDGFFDPTHLPLSGIEREGIAARSFAPELRIVRRVLQMCEARLLELMDSESAESFPEPPARRSSSDRSVERKKKQGGFGRLLEVLNDTGAVLDAAEDSRRTCRFFVSLGRSFRRDIRGCYGVDLLLAQRFKKQFDRIDQPVLSSTVRSISDARLRRDVSLALLYLFRFLRYLGMISNALEAERTLKPCLVVFSLLHRESAALSDFLKSTLLKEKEPGGLPSAVGLMIRTQKMDFERVFLQELPGVAQQFDPTAIHAAMQNSCSILQNSFQSSAVMLVQAFDGGIEGKSIFPSMIEKLQESQKLRRDLWNLRQFMGDILDGRSDIDLPVILDRIARFREESLRSLMYQDWGEFERFSEALIISGDISEAGGRLREFIQFLDLLMQEVSKRSLTRESAPVPPPRRGARTADSDLIPNL